MSRMLLAVSGGPVVPDLPPPVIDTSTWTALRQVADASCYYSGGGMGVQAVGAGSIRMRLNIRSRCKDIRFIFRNKDASYGFDKMALEIGDSIVPITFGGARSVTTPSNGYVTSDPLSMVFAKNDVVWLRYSASGSAVTWVGGWRLGMSAYSNSAGDVVDLPGWPTQGTGLYPMYPSGVTAMTPTSSRSCMIFGDSITEGGNDNAGGWGVRGCNAAGVAYINAGLWMQSMPGIVSDAGVWTEQGLWQMGSAGLTTSTHALCGYGTNDMASRTVAQLKVTYQALWGAIADAGVVPAQRTITPFCSSTDNFVTLENQTPLAEREPTRLAINEWLRTEPGGVKCIDSAAEVEHGGSAAPSGKWRIDLGAIAGDGVHAGPGGHALMALPVTAWLNE